MHKEFIRRARNRPVKRKKVKRVKLKEIPVENKVHDGVAYFQVTGGTALAAAQKYVADQKAAEAALSKLIRALRKELKTPFKSLGLELYDRVDLRPKVMVGFELKKCGKRSKTQIRDAFDKCLKAASPEFQQTWHCKLSWYSETNGTFCVNGKHGIGRKKLNSIRKAYGAIPTAHDFSSKYLNPQNETTRFGVSHGQGVMRFCTLQQLDPDNDVFVITVPIASPEKYEVKLHGVTGLKRLKMSQYWRLREKVGV